MPDVDLAGPAGEPPAGEPDAVWELSAVDPGWRPPPGEDDVPVGRGRLELHPEALVFRADDVFDRATGEPVVGVIPAAAIVDAGPLSPGSLLNQTRAAGEWMRGPLQGMRCPGFAISTAAGAWGFGCPGGVRRADEVRRRYLRE
jgi:hypothetical protein